MAAPVLVVVIRIFQGIALGGEWGGAALLSVENAPAGRKGLFGSSTQIGSPAGLLLASVAIAASQAVSGDAFDTWGWRLPFWIARCCSAPGSGRPTTRSTTRSRRTRWPT